MMSNAPPPPTGAFRALAAVAERTRALSAPAAWGLIAALLAGVAALDLAVGAHLSTFLFYLTVAGVASWRFGERAGYAVVAVATLLAAAGDATRATLLRGLPLAIPNATLLCGEALHLAAALLFVLVVAGVRRALEHQRWLATTDPLTGALNRAAFGERLAHASNARAKGERSAALLLAYVDLDGFKALNDARGHAAGDTLLRLFASGARTQLGEDDMLARTGGDEFALLAAIPDDSDGEGFAHLLHRRLSGVLAAAGCRVTCSVGAVVVAPYGALDVAELVAAADALMYEAKRAGKDALRVGHMSAPLHEPLPRPRLRLVVSDAA